MQLLQLVMRRNVRCVAGNIRHFRATRTGSGIPVQLQMVVSADSARLPRAADNANRTKMRCSPPGPLAASAPGTAAERSGRAPTCCNRGASVLTKGVWHRHASVERIKLHSEHGDGTWFSSSARAANAQPLSHRLESSCAQQLLQQGTARLRL